MLTRLECLPCFLRQTIIALSQDGEISDPLRKEVLNSVLSIMQQADMEKPPAYTTTFIHRVIRNKLGRDPFESVKRKYNAVAEEICRGLREKVEGSSDPLLTAARLAIAGNVIDFGIFTSIDIGGSIERALAEIAVDDFDLFKSSVRRARDILYLLDNAGEIVFDRLLIERLRASGKNVTAVVKGSPVLNDVTMKDAVETGLGDICRVIDNGSDCVGTILQWTSAQFREEFLSTDLVISKGQGNFETLSGNQKEVFFLFQAKCSVVSKELDLSPGSMLLRRSSRLAG